MLIDLVGQEHLTVRHREQLKRVQRALGTFKVDWAMSSPVPWTDPELRSVGTVRIAERVDEPTMTALQIELGTIPDRPFVLVGQMTTTDPTRSPEGTESPWANSSMSSSSGGRCPGAGEPKPVSPASSPPPRRTRAVACMGRAARTRLARRCCTTGCAIPCAR